MALDQEEDGAAVATGRLMEPLFPSIKQAASSRQRVASDCFLLMSEGKTKKPVGEEEQALWAWEGGCPSRTLIFRGYAKELERRVKTQSVKGETGMFSRK